MEIKLRQETQSDFDQVSTVIEEAFKELEISDQSEHRLVDRLRTSSAFIPELSIVALLGDEVVGHVLLTKIIIKNGVDSTASLSLAPISVKPKYQRRGIGGQLIREAHRTARKLGYKSVILVGHETYYPRFGYEKTSKYGISLPFEAPEENCMVKELKEGTLSEVQGMVVYPKAFFEE